MNRLFLVFAAAITSLLNAQPADTSAISTKAVQELVRLSKKHQWIDPHQSLSYADQALLKAQEIAFDEGIASAKIQKGFSFWTFGDNELAIQESLEALEIGRRLESGQLQAESCYVLARGYMDVREGEKAWESIRQAERLAQSGTDWPLMCGIYNLMGVIQFIDGREDSALYWYNKAYETGKQNAVDPIEFPRIISNIGECYAVENPALAFDYFGKALELAEKTGNQIAKASIMGIIGNAYLRGNDLRKSEDYFIDALKLARRLGLRRVVRHAYGGLVDIRLRQGNGNEAVVYLRRYYEVRDSLLGVSKVRQIVELESKHALQLKEQNIRLLENEQRIQSLWNNILVGLVLLLLVAGIAAYQWQKYRHMKNREILGLEIENLTRRTLEAEARMKATLVPAGEEDIESYDQQLLRKAIAVVEAHLADTQFGVEMMAEEMHMSRTGLHRKIKSITGFPPREFIRSIRLHKAAKLILGKAEPVSQIAQRVGFEDYSHFSKSFKKHFGVSPSQYESQGGTAAAA